MNGLGISEGIAIGKAWMPAGAEPDFTLWPAQSAEASLEALQAALATLDGLLESRVRQASTAGKTAQAEVFEAHRMMVGDPELVNGVQGALESGQPLPEAVRGVLGGFAALMAAMEDEYLKQRAQDYLDIRGQLLRLLAGQAPTAVPEPTESWIAVADDFSPSDIALTENDAVKGFLCQGGAATTHFSILARIAGTPTVLQVPDLLQTLRPGDLVALDGATGQVLVNPDPQKLQAWREKAEAHQAFLQRLEGLKTQETLTLDGVRLHLEGNIAGAQDLPKLLENGAEGVGLFRTEFLYMDRTEAPSEEEQTAVYRQVLQDMAGRPTVIRTLDVGGDKELPYLGIAKEENPFLGFRAVRYCLKHPELFKTQLRALLKASSAGDLHIMVPMVSGLEEVCGVRALLEACRKELAQEGVESISSVKLGIMIEVPAAAAMAELLAQEVDFFSIGTNDLIQYVMAADRMNREVAYLYTPYHPAFIRTLKSIIDGGHRGGIPVAMCGELAGDGAFIPVLVGLGLDQFSMNASALLKARLRIRTLKQADCRQLVEDLLQLKTCEEIRDAVASFNREHPYETA